MDLTNMSYVEKFRLAENPSTPENVLRELAKDKDGEVRRYVAENPSTPKDVLRDLAKDEDWTVREYVAKNSNTPVDVLRELAKDKSWEVRWEVALNNNIPIDIFRDLGQDDSWGIRENIAHHPKASSNLLIMQFEYEKNLAKPESRVIHTLYRNRKLPAFAKRVIETLFKDML